ncbi:coil containing protein [Vibrio phage 1.188.A._10N.286.51.A6]|uniref:Coil containing protein n=3 Tax=Mukerjeevirus mv51A6 TaxID=2734162 RepID=A0A2I7RIY5_9CAUD|nr:virion structural protein [Vibrio phage 1.188.A._10N.286.51.A6]AUR93618.1 coil containing protein [Vibrio phage 1.188.A._10N.286.51.A6]AUR93704.1 coil containing protein [Vibrio phage 1.188.B._10N.286.51.A6]AUR93790.1 coil containing protein [Vibrio phage 1.188.C._10N.286.51.A6]
MATNLYEADDMSALLELLTLNDKSGTGYFDVLMRSVHSHIQAEHQAGRITAGEYAKAYIEITNGTLGGVIQYIIQAPSAFKQALLADEQIAIAKEELKIREQEVLIRIEELEQAKLQGDLIAAQVKKVEAETLNIEQSTRNLIKQEEQLVHEVEASLHKAKALEYRVDAEYAATHDVLPDGNPVKGTIGKDNAQKEAQSLSFKMRDMFQMINANQSSNTAQITTLSSVDIAPTYTTGNSIDSAISKYYAELGITV